VPRKTLFIKGNHEDFVWLDAQHDPEVLPGLFYLRNGRTMDIGERPEVVRVGGLGGCFGRPTSSARRGTSKAMPSATTRAMRSRRSARPLRSISFSSTSASSATTTRASTARWPACAASASTRCACPVTSWQSTWSRGAASGRSSPSGRSVRQLERVERRENVKTNERTPCALRLRRAMHVPDRPAAARARGRDRFQIGGAVGPGRRTGR